MHQSKKDSILFFVITFICVIASIIHAIEIVNELVANFL